jgi:glycine cleavage system H protein
VGPTDLKYTRTHEWARIEGGRAVFGMTGHAVAEIRDIIFLDLQPTGQDLVQGKPFGTVESVKAVFDLNAPLSGKIVSVNSAVLEKPDLLAKDPTKDGWLVEIEVKNAAEAGSLMDAAAYEAFLKTEGAGH